MSIIGCKSTANLNKETIKIDDYRNNKYLGYVDFSKKSEDPKNKKWISGLYVYDKYIVAQMFYGFDPVGIMVYKRNNKINYNEYEFQQEVYLTREHHFMGIYGEYLFLLEMGNSPTYRPFKIVNLGNKEIIYEGVYIWDKGVNLVGHYMFEIYEMHKETILERGKSVIYHFVFDKYLLNIRTGEKTSMNKQIEIIGE
jgi:hypothetical protein